MHLVSVLVAHTLLRQNAWQTQVEGEKDRFQLTAWEIKPIVVGKARWRAWEVAGHSQEAGRDGCCAQFAFTFLFSPGTQPIVWFWPYYRVGLSPSVNLEILSPSFFGDSKPR